MKKMMAAALLLLTSAVFAEELSVGAKAPAFSLVNATDGKTVSFNPGDGALSVVVFTCNQCPYAKAFEPRLIEMAKGYAAKGVKFYLVNPNDEGRVAEESMDHLKARALARGYPFPYLKDADSSIARAYGARVTPHAYLVDGAGVVRYRGYIDDSAKPEERTKTSLANALDSLLAKKDVAETATKAFGCGIKWKNKA